MKCKIRFTTILLTFIFCIIPIVCTLMVHHFNITDTLSKMGSGSFGKSSSIIKVNGEISMTNLMQSLDTIHTRCALYIDTIHDVGTERYIYFNNRYVHLPMKNGRFLTASDFTVDFPVAVVGKGREDDLYINSFGEQCIIVDTTEYNVVGVIGYENATILDDYIYLGLNSLDFLDSPMIIVDYLDSEDCEGYSQLLLYQLENFSVSAELISSNISFSESIMPIIVSERLFVYIIICCFICLLLISLQWINSQRQEMVIRMLVGASPRNIAILITKKYFTIAIISFLVGYIYCIIFYSAYKINLIYGYLFSTIFIVAFLAWSVNYFLHLNIQEALR